MKILDRLEELMDRYEKAIAAFCYTQEAKENIFKEVARLINARYTYTKYNELEKALLNEGDIYVKYLEDSNALYDPKTRDIYVGNLNMGDGVEANIIHECIHKINENVNPSYKEEFKMNHFFLEATIEKIVKESMGTKNEMMEIGKDIYGYVPSDSGYEMEYIIMQQIDFILGNGKFERDVLTGGKEDAEEQFIKKYGLNLDLDIVEKLKKIRKYQKLETSFFGIEFIENKFSQKVVDEFLDLQNEILLMCFEKDYENIQSKEDIIKYIYKLKEFEFLRGRVKSQKDDGKNIDVMYEKYYEAKRKDLKELWREKTNLDIPKELNKKVDTEIDFDKIRIFLGGIIPSEREENYIIQIQKEKRKFMRRYIVKMPLNSVKKLVAKGQDELQNSLEEK